MVIFNIKAIRLAFNYVKWFSNFKPLLNLVNFRRLTGDVAVVRYVSVAKLSILILGGRKVIIYISRTYYYLQTLINLVYKESLVAIKVT